MFHFRGARGLLAFAPSIPTIQWQLIRNLHISTLVTRNLWVKDPNLDKWTECCQYLRYLPNLQSLRLGISIQRYKDLVFSPTMDEIVVATINPLKGVKAKIFEVEIDEEISQSVWDQCSNADFKISVRTRDDSEYCDGSRPKFID
jgi:hypothetical protein